MYVADAPTLAVNVRKVVGECRHTLRRHLQCKRIANIEKFEPTSLNSKCGLAAHLI